MMDRVLGGILFAVLLLVPVGAQQAFATTIDFDFFPDETPVPDRTRITDQYAQCGVKLFTTEVPEGPQTFAFSLNGGSNPNQLGADGTPNPSFTHSIGVEFVSPVSEASITALDVDFNGLILEAYNSANGLVDSVQVINPQSSAIQVDLMTVSGDDIVSLVIKQVTPGGKQGFLIDGYNIDDLQFPGPPCEIPEELPEEIPVAPEELVVGGEFLPIDTTALFLTGLQSSAIWMLPVLAGVAGAAFGILYLTTRHT